MMVIHWIALLLCKLESRSMGSSEISSNLGPGARAESFSTVPLNHHKLDHHKLEASQYWTPDHHDYD